MTTDRRYYGLGLGLALATVLFLILAIGALGIVGDGGRADRIFLGVLVVLGVGALLARFRPAGMTRALMATAAAQALLGLAATVAVLAGVDDYDGASVVDVVGITLMYASLFAASAWLFHRSTRPARTLHG